MLSEVATRQSTREPRRRWFSDDDFDLVVWFSDSGVIVGFELCYDRSRVERALVWSNVGGYGHFRVDTGESTPQKNLTPILLADSSAPFQRPGHRWVPRGLRQSRPRHSIVRPRATARIPIVRAATLPVGSQPFSSLSPRHSSPGRRRQRRSHGSDTWRSAHSTLGSSARRSTRSAKDSVTAAMWKGRTSSSSTERRTARWSGLPLLRPSWRVSRSTSSAQLST